MVGLEALLIGPGIGVSPTATLLMLAFWTWLWGPIALLLATPLTACLMVMARFLPQFRFLEIALGDRPVLEAPDRLYQRLLARDVEESTRLFQQIAHADGFLAACDKLLLPALSGAASDLASQRINAEEHATVVRSAEALLEAVGPDVEHRAEADRNRQGFGRPLRVLCIARDEADRLGHSMLRLATDPEHFAFEVSSSDLLISETVELIGRTIADAVCIGSTPPGGLMTTKLLCRRLRKRVPKVTIIVARWGVSGREAEERDILLDAGASSVYNSVEDLRLALIALHPADSKMPHSTEPDRTSLAAG